MGLNPKKCSYPLKPPKSAQTLKKRSGMAESVSNQGFARKKCYNGISRDITTVPNHPSGESDALKTVPKRASLRAQHSEARADAKGTTQNKVGTIASYRWYSGNAAIRSP